MAEIFTGLQNAGPELRNPKYAFQIGANAQNREGSLVNTYTTQQGTYQVDENTGLLSFTPSNTFFSPAERQDSTITEKLADPITIVIKNLTTHKFQTGTDILKYGDTEGAHLFNSTSYNKVSSIYQPLVEKIQPARLNVASALGQIGESIPVPVNYLQDNNNKINVQSVEFVNSNKQPIGKSLTIEGQGTWTINDNGIFVFKPVPGFISNPDPVYYTAKDLRGDYVTAPAQVKAQIIKPMTQHFITVGDKGVKQFSDHLGDKGDYGNSLYHMFAGLPDTWYPNLTFGLLQADGTYSDILKVDEGLYELDPIAQHIKFTPNPEFVGVATPVTVAITQGLSEVITSTYTPYVLTVPDEKEVIVTHTITDINQTPIYRPNTNLAPGEIKTITEGFDGYSLTITETQYINGVEQSDPKITLVKKDPVNSVIEYGASTQDVQVSVDKKVILQQGRDGYEFNVTQQPLVNDEPSGDPKVASYTQEVLNTIIEVGAQTQDKLVTTDWQDIPYQIQKQFNDNLKPGEVNVLQAGQNGYKVTITTQNLVNDQAMGDPQVQVFSQEAQDLILEIGSGTPHSFVAVEKTDLPRDTEIRINTNLAPGEYNIIQAGQDGYKFVVSKQEQFNGANIGDPIIQTYERPAQNTIIEIGNQSPECQITSQEVAIPQTIEYVYTKDLLPGVIETVQEGKDGYTITVTTQPTINGKATGESKETVITQEAVNTVIRVGIADENTYVSTDKVDIPHVIEIIEDPTLAAGTSQIKQQGQDGYRLTVTKQEQVNGVNVGDPIVETLEKEVKNTIIVVGTQAKDKQVTINKASENYTVEIRQNTDLKPGETKIIQEGRDGYKVTVSTQALVNGEPVGDTIEEVIQQEMQPLRIEVGSATLDTLVTTEQIDIPHQVIIQEDELLKAGEYQLVQQGQDEYSLLVTSHDTVNGQVVGEPIVEEYKREATDTIIKVGKGTNDLIISTQKDVIPYTVETRENPNLLPSETRVLQKGQDGFVVTVSKQTLNNGQPNGLPTKELISQEMKPFIVEVGTADEHSYVAVTQEDYLAKTQIVYNPDLQALLPLLKKVKMVIKSVFLSKNNLTE